MNIHASYVVCAVQRSGSSLLCEALKNTGLASVPEEYFLYHEDDNSWENGRWAQEHGVTSQPGYIHLVLEKGTTPNGVFGTKLMWNYFPHVIGYLQQMPDYAGLDAPQLLPKLLPNLHFIWIVWEDKVRQAVSWAIAAQTGIYAAWQEEVRPSLQEPVFDFTLIDNLHRLVLEGERGWQDFFTTCDVTPFKVVYEELTAAYEVTALQILDYLHVPYLNNLTFGERKLRKQATSLNEEWAQRYREMKTHKGEMTNE